MFPTNVNHIVLCFFYDEGIRWYLPDRTNPLENYTPDPHTHGQGKLGEGNQTPNLGEQNSSLVPTTQYLGGQVNHIVLESSCTFVFPQSLDWID